MSLVSAFDELIDPEWKLARSYNYWQITEPGSQHSLLEIGGGKSYAFSLDHREKRERFPFFRANPQRGMRKANDAIIIAEYDGRLFVISVEMKTSINDKSSALKQIESGRHFVNWIDNLFRLYGHWQGEYLFFGVLSLKPRRQEKKGTTRRSAELPDPEKCAGGYPVFVLANHPRVLVSDLIKKLDLAG
jgi:hypothetical protein